MNTRFFRELMLIPARAKLLVASRKDVVSATNVRYQIWMRSRDVGDAVALIAGVFQYHPIKARQLIAEIAETTCDSTHLALLAAMDYSHTGDAEWVSGWISRARTEEYANQGMLSYLELILLDPRAEPERAIDLSDQLLEQDGAPPQASATALYNRFLALLRLGRIPEAQTISEKMLAISHSPLSVQMALSLRFAQGSDSVDDLVSMLPQSGADRRSFMIAVARADSGHFDQAIACLHECNPDWLRKVKAQPHMSALIVRALDEAEEQESDS
jgi:tetratricopeptide (TPR) repeat protein